MNRELQRASIASRFRRALRLEFLEDRRLLAASLQAAADQADDGYVCPLETPLPADFTRLVTSQHGQVFEIFQDPEEDRALWMNWLVGPDWNNRTGRGKTRFAGGGSGVRTPTRKK